MNNMYVLYSTYCTVRTVQYLYVSCFMIKIMFIHTIYYNNFEIISIFNITTDTSTVSLHSTDVLQHWYDCNVTIIL